MFFLLLLKVVTSCSVDNCVECVDENICTRCNPTLYLNSNSCVSICPSNYYPDIINNVKQCLKCNDKCLECYNGTPNSCTKCMQPLKLMCGNCVDTNADLGCSDCSSQCITCFGRTSSECYQCKLPYFHSQYANSCSLTCEYPYYGDLSDFQCKQRCPSDFYGQPITRQCMMSCPDPYFKNLLNQDCVQICPNGTYPQSRSCLICYSTCETCIGGLETDCTYCREGYFMSDSKCGNCQNNQYSNQVIRQCVDYITYSLNILEAYDSTIVFEISFSGSIDTNTLDINTQIQVIDMDPSQYIINSTSIEDDQYFIFNIDFSVSHRITDIQCNFTNNITNQDKTPIQRTNAIQNLSIPAQFVSPSNETKIKEINTYLIIAYLSYYCLLFLLCFLFATQRRMFYFILNNLQCVQVMILINFSFPTLTLNSLELLDIVNLKQIQIIGITQNGVILYFFNTPILNQVPNNNILYNAGYYYNFIANGGIFILGIFILIWLIWLVFYIMHNIIQINNKVETTQIYSKLREGSNDLLVRVHEFLYLPLLLISVLQLWGYDFNSDINIASFTLSILTILYYLLYFRSVYKSQFLDLDQQEMENKYFTFFSDFKQSNEIKKNFEFVNYFFKTSLVLSLVLLNNYPYIQFSISFTLIVLYFALLIQKRPYLRNIMNYSAVFGYLVFLGLFTTTIISEVLYQQLLNQVAIPNEDIQKQYNYGLAFMIQIQILLGTYALVFSYNKLQDYLKFLDKNPDWGKGCLQKMERALFSDKIQTEVEMANMSSIS